MAHKLKVALVGCGDLGRGLHLPVWKELAEQGRVDLVAVCDVLGECAQETAGEFGAAKYYSDVEQLLKNEQVDILDVCSQNRLHAQMALQGLEAGAHVLVEKPLAMNLAEAQGVIEAAARAGRLLMVGQQLRFEPANELLKDIVDRGELGRIYTARVQWLRRRAIPGKGLMHVKSEALGGAVIDSGMPMLDLALWMLDYPRALAVNGKVYRMFGDREDLYNGPWGREYHPREFDVEDYATALIRLENDITISLEVCWAANIPGEVQGLSVLGDKAGIANNPPAMYGVRGGSLTATRFEEFAPAQAHRAEIRHFVSAIEQNLPLRVLPAQSLELQRIIDAIYQSSDENREVRLDDAAGGHPAAPVERPALVGTTFP